MISIAQQIIQCHQLGVTNNNNNHAAVLPMNSYTPVRENTDYHSSSSSSNKGNSHGLFPLIPAALQANLSLSSCTAMKDSWLELIADTYQACNIAVDILNDLLMYEKIDGGLMALDASEVSLWPLMDEVFKMFNVQVMNVLIVVYPICFFCLKCVLLGQSIRNHIELSTETIAYGCISDR